MYCYAILFYMCVWELTLLDFKLNMFYMLPLKMAVDRRNMWVVRLYFYTYMICVCKSFAFNRKKKLIY